MLQTLQEPTRNKMPSLLELQDLYFEALVRELIEKTKSCGVVWTHVGGFQFHSLETDSNTNIDWDFYVTKTRIGNTASKWTLDIKKDSVSYISIEEGPLPRTGRSSLTQELYEIVELIVLQLDAKLKETIQFIQNIETCRS